MTITNIINIVTIGGSIMIDCKAKATSDLVSIASAAQKSRATVILTNLKGKTPADLTAIAKVGMSNVILDLRDM